MITSATSDPPERGKIDADWPNRDASRLVRCEALTWHLQQTGPIGRHTVLLVHGTGASTHTWRDILPILAAHHRVVAIDLPGHGFTSGETRDVLTLPGMAAATGALLRQEGIRPTVVVGHSAGVAVLAQMCVAGLVRPSLLVAINGALLPFPGVSGALFPALAKLLYLNPLVPRVLAWRAGNRENVKRLITQLGSEIDAAGLDLYTRLFRDTRHVDATIKMMASWNLRELADALPRLPVPVLIIAGTNDRAVPVETQFDVRDRLPEVTVKVMRGLGHLAHEEQPAIVAQLILEAMTPLDPQSTAPMDRSEAPDDTAHLSRKTL